jgi:hypothetical protein
MQDDMVVNDSSTAEAPEDDNELKVPVTNSHKKPTTATDRTIISRTENTGVIALIIRI